LVDLGVPRNIEPEIAALEDAYLYCIDDLQNIIQEGLYHRQQAAQQAELLIDVHASEFTRRMRARQATQLICTLRRKAEKTRDVEIKKALASLKRGENPEISSGPSKGSDRNRLGVTANRPDFPQ